VALVFEQTLIGIDFNFLAQLGDFCKNLFQNIFVDTLFNFKLNFADFYYPIDSGIA